MVRRVWFLGLFVAALVLFACTVDAGRPPSLGEAVISSFYDFRSGNPHADSKPSFANVAAGRAVVFIVCVATIASSIALTGKSRVLEILRSGHDDDCVAFQMSTVLYFFRNFISYVSVAGVVFSVFFSPDVFEKFGPFVYVAVASVWYTFVLLTALSSLCKKEVPMHCAFCLAFFFSLMATSVLAGLGWLGPVYRSDLIGFYFIDENAYDSGVVMVG